MIKYFHQKKQVTFFSLFSKITSSLCRLLSSIFLAIILKNYLKCTISIGLWFGRSKSSFESRPQWRKETPVLSNFVSEISLNGTSMILFSSRDDLDFIILPNWEFFRSNSALDSCSGLISESLLEWLGLQ